MNREEQEKHVVLSGITIHRGIVSGRAYVWKKSNISIHQQHVENVDRELNRLGEALSKVKLKLTVLSEQVKEVKLGEDGQGIIEAQQVMLEDAQFLSSITDKIKTEKLQLEHAVTQTIEEITTYFQHLDDPYFQARVADIHDIGTYLLDYLASSASNNFDQVREQVILVTNNITVADALNLNRNFIVGVATAEGSPLAHVAIILRSLGIPSVSGLGEAIKLVQPGMDLVLDADRGELILQPSLAEVQKCARANMLGKEKLNQEREMLALVKEKKSVSADGRHISLFANLNTPADLKQIIDQNADGVGLLRTELYFQGMESIPSEEEQFQAYRSVVKALGNKPVTIRTFDFGGDKPFPYHVESEAEHAGLNQRGIRFCLANPQLFKQQLKAILRASYFGHVNILYPMISTLKELRAAKLMLEQAKEELQQDAIHFGPYLKVGMMVEVPAVALAADIFAREVDFFAIGSNDLLSYSFGYDRQHMRAEDLDQFLHPAMLRIIKQVVKAAQDTGIKVSLCGEIAQDELVLPLLLGLELDILTLDATGIFSTRCLLKDIHVEKLKLISCKALSLAAADEVKAMLNHIANS